MPSPTGTADWAGTTHAQRRTAGPLTDEPRFPPQEYEQRVAVIRGAMERHGLDVLLVTAPEDIHYLCGLDHQDHFAVTGLVVPLDGEPVLVERAMEAATAAAQTDGVRHCGYGDATDPADALLAALTQAIGDAHRAPPAAVGYQADSLSLPPAVWDRLRTAGGLTWKDFGAQVSARHFVHTEREIALIRDAARLSDTAMAAGLAAATAGARENEIAATVYDTMLRAGGDLPAFAPLVRGTDRLDQEHLTWSRRTLGPRDTVFLELSAARGRYHAPLARLRRLGPAGAVRDTRAADASRTAMSALRTALHPGNTAEQVFRAWHSAIESALGEPYERHHCGYLIGIGFPPGWMGGSRTLRPGNTMELRAGMTFHIQSWLLGGEFGSHAYSDTALVTDDGCEILTRTP
ncbi:M24 family metallopeptidase [Streptomyces sp. NPDC057307]|uniref:M24 family metallopeptidase n=1 Tax=Streptomyces sp. NPDC057307 TaxID=3346096 RepID=UPI003635381B